MSRDNTEKVESQGLEEPACRRQGRAFQEESPVSGMSIWGERGPRAELGTQMLNWDWEAGEDGPSLGPDNDVRLLAWILEDAVNLRYRRKHPQSMRASVIFIEC